MTRSQILKHTWMFLLTFWKPPFTIARSSTFPRHQRSKKKRTPDNRLNKDVQVTPIALLYCTFGQCLDHIHDRPGETDDVDLTKLETAVDKFTSVMCQRYDYESRPSAATKS